MGITYFLFCFFRKINSRENRGFSFSRFSGKSKAQRNEGTKWEKPLPDFSFRQVFEEVSILLPEFCSYILGEEIKGIKGKEMLPLTEQGGSII